MSAQLGNSNGHCDTCSETKNVFLFLYTYRDIEYRCEWIISLKYE